MKKLNIIFIILGILLIVAAGVLAVCFATGTNSVLPSLVSSDSGSTTFSTNSPTAVPTQGSVVPFTPTASPTTTPMVSSPSDPLVGTWQGSKSLFFGMAEAKFTLTVRLDGTMTIAGIANAPIAGIENMPFSVDASWTHLSGTTYVGSIGDQSQEFTCDGSTIYLTVNPYATGLIDNEMLNMDIDLALTRQ